MKYLICGISSLILISFSASTNAKTYTDTAKCAVIVYDKSIAPKTPPKWVTGVGVGKTKSLACAAAKKSASSKAPKGTQAKHCDCGKKI